MQKQLISLRRW